uniref:Uncharacterized protein n=1 Tax=Chaetoceros debilis TaxID=122233 RepID=A0A7S3V945_9STRA
MVLNKPKYVCSRRVTRNTKVLIMVIAVAAIVILPNNHHNLLVASVTKDLPSQQNQMGYNQDSIRKSTSSIEEVQKGKQKHDNEVDGDYKKDDQNQSIPSKRTSSTEEDKKVYHDDKVDGDYKKDDVGKTPIKSGSQVDILSFDGIPSRFWTCQRDSADTEQKKRKLFLFIYSKLPVQPSNNYSAIMPISVIGGQLQFVAAPVC